jgi:hypothetical protein
VSALRAYVIETASVVLHNEAKSIRAAAGQDLEIKVCRPLRHAQLVASPVIAGRMEEGPERSWFKVFKVRGVPL